MCLSTYQQTAYTAEKDITCYKVVSDLRYSKPCGNCGKPFFVSIFQSFVYKIGKHYNERHFRSKNTIKSSSRSYSVYYGFHSYRTLEIARFWCASCDVIIKCVIPKGARYFESSNTSEYCSNKIKVVAWRKGYEKRWHTEEEINK